MVACSSSRSVVRQRAGTAAPTAAAEHRRHRREPQGSSRRCSPSRSRPASSARSPGSGPLTVFAPTDAAFKAVPKATLAKLANDQAALRRVLLYHVVKGNVTAAVS